ncbi:MAG: tetraacyldisaccharide 4'-kinase [bacterium]|nr:tetraacyldisaccharide 4'-kinase [bacterium]
MKSHSRWLNIIEEKPPYNRNYFLLAGLYLLSLLYALIVLLRNWAYRTQIFKSQKLSIPVISVGNITVGGTGKTPVVLLLAKYFQKQGKKVAILSRGYKRANPAELCLVSDYEKVVGNWREAGDEPYLLAESLPGVAVIVGNKRKISGEYAIKNLNAELLILDDGFSHQQVARTLNLVLIDATKPFSNEQCLPAGLLREPISSLTRADVIVLTKTKLGMNYSNLVTRIHQFIPSIPIFFSTTSPSRVVEISSKAEHPVSMLMREPIVAFAGIANPTAFRDTLQELNAEVKRWFPFPDHYVYTENDINSLLEQAAQDKCRYLVTTQKDAVKVRDLLEKFAEYKQQFLTLEINIEIENGTEFYTLINNKIKT